MSFANPIRGAAISGAAISFVCACGGGSQDPSVDGGDAAPAPDAGPATFPRDVPDDVEPYDLAASCEELIAWTLPVELSHPAHVAAASRTEAWVIADHAPTPDAGGTLAHLAPDGTVIDTGWRGVHDVWTCGDETWAVGRGGLLIRRAAGGDFAPIALPVTADLLSGFGCADELWLVAGDRALVLRGDEVRTIAIDTQVAVTWPLRAHGAGSIRVATEYYGSVLEYDPVADAFLWIGSTDDIVTDAFVRRDGTGITLHGGYGLHFDPIPPPMHEFVDGLTAVRVSRRSDEDAWFVAGDTATHLTPLGFETIALPGFYGDDVDARADAVWAVGFDGAAILTVVGFCPVAGPG